MDILRNCTSGVHLLNCFQTITFRVYALEGDNTTTPNRQRTSRKLRDVEATLRDLAVLISADFGRKELWAFSGTNASNTEDIEGRKSFVARLDDVFKLPADFELRLLHKGEVKPAELLAEDLRNEFKGLKRFTPAHIHWHFLAACTHSVSYQLTQAGLLPLNIRTFAIKTKSEDADTGPAGWDVLSFTIQLNPTGCLRVSTRWENNVGISCLAEILESAHLSHYYEAPFAVRISPCGDLALAWPSLSTPNVSLLGRVTHSQPEDTFQPNDKLKWREAVVQWLKTNKIETTNIHNHFKWVKILVNCNDRHFLHFISDGQIDTDTVCVEWPSHLCFLQDSDDGTREPHPNLAPIQGGQILSHMSWFQHGNMHGFEDPLHSALDWMENKPYRESELEARASRMAVEIEEPATAQGPSPDLLDWLSPSESRVPTSQEVQNIYPTPSDGLPNQVTPTAISTDAKFPTDTGLPSVEQMEVEEKATSSNSGENAHLVRHSSFGDSDRYIGAMTLTDLDFDFFDQPNDVVVERDLSKQHVEVPADKEIHKIPVLESIDEVNENDFMQSINMSSNIITNELIEPPPLTALGIDGSISREDYLVDPVVDDCRLNGKADQEMLLTPSTNPTNVEETFDDSKYSGGGRFGFGLRDQRRKRKFASPDAKPIRRPSNQQFSTSILRSGKVPSRRRSSPNNNYEDSDDEDSEDENSSESQPDFSTWTLFHRSRTFGPHFKVPEEQATAGSIEETSYANKTDIHNTARDILGRIFAIDSTSWILTPYLHFSLERSHFELYLQPLEPSERTFIAQLLARQVIFSLLDPNCLDQSNNLEYPLGDNIDSRAANMQLVSRALAELTSASSYNEADLASYLLWESPEVAQEKERNIFPIVPPHISVQKGGEMWDFGAAAATFWEMLGLEPASGPKNVSAFAVYPWSEAIEESIDHFLQAIESAWQGHKLGGHVPGYLDDGSRPGHIPVHLGNFLHDHNLERLALKSFLLSCHNLGTRLKNTLRPEDTAVVYIINPFKNEPTISKLCECFLAVLKAYGAGLTSAEQLNIRNIVLQVVPIDLVACSSNPVFLDPDRSATIAHKVYGCCPCQGRKASRDSLAIPSGASITLTKPIPKNIRFQLSTTPSNHVLAEGSRIHVAYSESLCGRWLTAAWTDDTGEYQHTAFYPHNEKIEMSAIIGEIWQTTLEIISPIDVHWRIIVARAGILPVQEKNIWHDLAARSSSAHHALCLVSVNTLPCLTVSMKMTAITTALENGAATNNPHPTPVSTPHAHQNPSPAAVSPSNPTGSTPSNTAVTDQHGMGDIESSSQLVDKTDESWGFVLPRRLNVANSIVDFNQALASGYLMKRTSVNDDEEPVLMEVNLMHLQEVGKVFGAKQAYEELQSAKGRRYEKILGEILIMYRNLGLLARLQKIENAHSCAPWHVAVALRGSEALRKYMEL